LNIDLPCFCYHEGLSIAGNCRICLVEVVSSLKLVISCATPVINNMVIYTNTFRLKVAREGVLEFLLSSHPLDCPVCDQGGECDLQDITLILGSDKGRFYENFKRTVEDMDCSVLVKMVMTRCIHCTRCIRFFTEVGGSFDFGMIGRGVSSKVSVYVSKNMNHELSGNIIDLCPVGALTSKPYLFVSRVWELNSFESVDIFDTLGYSIRLDIIRNKVIRVLPVPDYNVNEGWLTNLARFSYDALVVNRLMYPLVNTMSRPVVIS